MEKHYGRITQKFVNVMFFILVILGFLEWVDVSNTLQYILFLFTYFVFIKYWLNHGEHNARFPPKSAAGVFIDITAMIVLFLLLQSALMHLGFYFASLAVLLAIDSLRLSRTIWEYKIPSKILFSIKSRRVLYSTEATIYVLFETIAFQYGLSAVFGVTGIMVIWFLGRISESRV